MAGSPAPRTDRNTNTYIKPNKIIVVPAEYRPRVHITDVRRLCDFWQAEVGCKIVPQWADGKLMRFELFGSGPPLDSAVRKVNHWIENAKTKSSASSAWSKTPAFDANKWYYGEIEEMEMERKQKFRGPLPEDEEIPFRAVVTWPAELLHGGRCITPRDVFGNKLEALDKIRVQDEVYITLLPQKDTHQDSLWQVEIRGEEDRNVEMAVEHYGNLVQKVLHKQLTGSTVVNIILDESEGSHLTLKQSEDWWPRRQNGIAPEVVPQLLVSLIDGSGQFRDEPLHPKQIEEIEQDIRQSLEAVRLVSGTYDFSIRLGCLYLENLDDPRLGAPQPLLSFKKAIKGKLSCHTKKWFARNYWGQQLLERLMESDHLLEPTHPAQAFFGSIPSSLKETRPTFRATFVMGDPNQLIRASNTTGFRNPGRVPALGSNQPPKSGPQNHIIVQIDWTEDEFGDYEKMAPRYFEIKNEWAKENLDINLIELAESRAWHFGLESMTAMPKSTVPAAIIGFAKSVAMKPKYGENVSSTDIFATFTQTASVNIRSFRLEKIYTFGIKETGYRVEAMAMWYPMQKAPVWGLSVRHNEWATHLGSLETLPTGHGADWGEDDVVKVFIPDNGKSCNIADHDDTALSHSSSGEIHGQGIKLLVDRLMQLSKIVKPPAPAPPVSTLGTGLGKIANKIKLLDLEE